MFSAERIIDESSSQQRAQLRYFLSKLNQEITVDEDTALVDGIGGTTWEGALVLARVFESIASQADSQYDLSHCHVLELGCGTGLVGIVANKLGFRATITDRVADLAASNILQNCYSSTQSRKRRAFSKDGSSPSKNSKHRTQEVMHSFDPDYHLDEDLSKSLHVDENRQSNFEEVVKVITLPWGSNVFMQYLQQDTFASSSTREFSSGNSSSQQAVEGIMEMYTNRADDVWSVDKLCSERGGVDIVVGAEITCLRKQHSALVETIVEIARINPKVVILLTFDGFYVKDCPPSVYEKEFIDRMKCNKFRHSLVAQAEIHWDGNSSNRKAQLISHDCLGVMERSLVFPRPISTSSPKDPLTMDVDDREIAGDNSIPTKNGANIKMDDKDNVFHHHVLAFYLSDAVLTCQRCHREYFAQSNCHSPSSTGNLFNSLILAQNAVEGCHFHRGAYVCRRHPSETKCSINGLGDQLGYYSNGKEGWKAEFWDCCGSENPDCSGCCFDRHIPY